MVLLENVGSLFHQRTVEGEAISAQLWLTIVINTTNQDNSSLYLGPIWNSYGYSSLFLVNFGDRG